MQGLRVEMQAVGENDRAALEGMARKSEEFLERGGALYVEAGE